MKRIILTVAVLLSAVSAGAISRSEFASSRKAALAPVYQNDGDAVVVFTVTPTTHTWTQIRPALATRRRLDIEVVNAATGSSAGVCVSTTSNAASACLNTTGGYELLMSTPQAKISLNGQTAWYARIRGGDANAAALRGADYYDSGD